MYTLIIHPIDYKIFVVQSFLFHKQLIETLIATSALMASFIECLLIIFQLIAVLVHTSGSVSNTASIIGSCPTWQFYNMTSKKCQCGDDLHGAVRCNETTNDIQILNCYCMTVNQSGQMEVGKCISGCEHVSSKKSDIHNHLPQDKSKVNEWLCGDLNKNGTLCRKCKNGYNPVVYTYDLSCQKCTSNQSQNIAKFVAATVVPLTVFYLLIVIFKVSATSPKLSSYVFFSQWIAEPMNVRVVLRASRNFPKLDFLPRCLATAYGIWNLDFFRAFHSPICLDVPPLLTFALDYVGAFYTLLLILFSYLLIKLHSHNVRVIVCLWAPLDHILTVFNQDWNKKLSMVSVFSTFFLLSYVKLLSVSLTLLLPTTLYDIHGSKAATVLYYDASVKYFSRQHFPYAVIAIVVLALFVMIPTLFLTLYPYKWFQFCLNCCKISYQAIHIFADCYLGWFKDGTERGTRDCRFIASLYLWVRICVAGFYGMTLSIYFYAFETVAMVILAVVVLLLKPYKAQWELYNTIEPSMVLFVALCSGALLCIDLASLEAFEFIYFSALLSFIVAVLPLLYIIGILLLWLFKHDGIFMRVVEVLKVKLRVRYGGHEPLEDSECAPVLNRLEKSGILGECS